MKRMTSKLTGAFVVLLLLAAAVTTANSQEKKASFIYGIDNDGTLKWHRHDGAATGATAWQGGNNVGAGWNDYKSVFPGGANIIYGIKADGTLEWRQHQGVRAGSDQWGDAKAVGRGWGDFRQVFSGGGGIIYAMTEEGKLLWYKHIGYLDGRGIGSPGAWEGPKEVGSGWNSFKHVFPGGNGIVYAIARDGKLLWYRHLDFANGVKAWEGSKEVGRGWGDFKNVFSSGDGIIYAITEDGKLQWRKYNGYMIGGGYDTWQGPTEIGRGWGDFLHAFALLPGSSSPAPEGRTRTSGGPGDYDTSAPVTRIESTTGRPPGAPLPPPEVKPEVILPPDTVEPLSPQIIRVRIRYKKELGYRDESNTYGDKVPDSCSAFAVRTTVVASGGGPFGNDTRVGVITNHSPMREGDGYYSCWFSIRDLPLNKTITIYGRIADEQHFLTERWRGGSQPQPPAGYQRTVMGNRGLTLTRSQPSATVDLEMIYVPLR